MTQSKATRSIITAQSTDAWTASIRQTRIETTESLRDVYPCEVGFVRSKEAFLRPTRTIYEQDGSCRETTCIP
jgi:hypothetical protein